MLPNHPLKQSPNQPNRRVAPREVRAMNLPTTRSQSKQLRVGTSMVSSQTSRVNSHIRLIVAGPNRTYLS